MQTLSSIEIDQLLQQVVQSVFESMLQIELMPVDESWPPSEPLYTAAVEFGAAPAIQIQLHFTAPQAFRAAASLMPIPLPDGMNEDVFDAMRELANMVAGNLKAILAPGSQLSIASVLSEEPVLLEQPVTASAAFLSEDLGVFWITLTERDSQPPARCPMGHQFAF